MNGNRFSKRQIRELFAPERRPSPVRNKHLFAWLCAVIGGAALLTLAGALLFPKPPLQSKDMVLSVRETSSTRQQQIRHFTFTYTNTSKVELADMSLLIDYPVGFAYLEATPHTPENSGRDSWNLPSLQPGESRTLEVSGSLIGGKGEEKNFAATMYYRPANQNGEFSSRVVWRAVVSKDSAGIMIDGPREAYPATPIEYRFVVDDLSTLPMSELSYLRILAPSSFGAQKFSLPPERDGSLWSIPTLTRITDKKTHMSTIMLQGAFSRDVAPPHVFEVSLGMMRDGAFFPLQTKRQEINVRQDKSGDDYSVRLLLDESEVGRSVSFGETLRWRVHIDNKTPHILSDAEVTVSFIDRIAGLSMGEWKAGTHNGTGKDLSAHSIVWKHDEIPELKDLDPDEKVTIDFPIYIAKTLDKSDGNMVVSVGLSGVPELETNKDKKRIQVTGNTIKTPLNSDFTLDYAPIIMETFDTSGQPKTYRIPFTVNNSLHDLDSLRLEATIPSNVRWGGNQTASAGSIEYHEAQRTVIWNLNRMPRGVGNINMAFDLVVDLSLKHREQVRCEKSSPVPLLSKLRITAHDSITQSPLSQEGSVSVQAAEIQNCR